MSLMFSLYQSIFLKVIIFFCVLQDEVSPISSSLFIMILPAGLLSELAEIGKLLVSGMPSM